MNAKKMSLVLGAIALCAGLALVTTARAGDGPAGFGINLSLHTPIFRVGTDAALFEQPRYQEQGILYVRQDTGSWQVFRGPTYAKIVETNPTLKENPELDTLSQRVKTDLDNKVQVTTLEPGYRIWINAPSLSLLRTSDSDTTRLYVKNAKGEYVYLGKDLGDIIQQNPDLKDMTGMSELQSMAKDLDEFDIHAPAASRSTSTPPPAGTNPPSGTHPTDTMGGSSVLEVDVGVTNDQAVLHAWSDKDGQWDEQRFEAKDLPALRQKLSSEAPDLAKSIGLEGGSESGMPSESPPSNPTGGTGTGTGQHPSGSGSDYGK